MGELTDKIRETVAEERARSDGGNPEEHRKEAADKVWAWLNEVPYARAMVMLREHIGERCAALDRKR